MSGSLWYTIGVGHVYQRKFTTEELAKALAGYHLYAISRRPATRIHEASIQHQSTSTRLAVTVASPPDYKNSKLHLLEIDWDVQGGSFRTYLDGSYFSVLTDDKHLLHGDAWALATAATGAQVDIADQEIMYIGQAYGQHGERSVYDRTKEHQKLQRIYEDHAGEPWDIFISPILIESTHWDNWDHLPDDQRGIDVKASQSIHGDPRNGAAPKLSVDVVEHALISAFKPPYNDKLRDWSAANPSAGMRALQRCGFRLLTITLSGTNGMARYYTQKSWERTRGKSFYFGLTEVPKRPALDPLDPRNWDEIMQMNLGAAELMALRAEVSNVILRWFGSEAPPIRKPPEVAFPQLYSKSDYDTT